MATNNYTTAVVSSEFILLTSLDTLQLTSLLGLNATTPLYEANMKAEATQKDLLVILEESIIACGKVPTHIYPKDCKNTEEIMRLVDFECYNELTTSSGNLGQSCPGMGRLGIGNLLLEPEVHKNFISGFITKLPHDDLVLTRLVYQGVRKIQDENGQWENKAIPLYFEGFFYLKRELIYEAFNNAFERVENLGLVPTEKKSRTSKAPRPIDKVTVFCPLCEDCRFTRDGSMIYHLQNHFNLKKFRCLHKDKNGGPCLNKDRLPNQYLHPAHFKDHVARKHFFCEMCHIQYKSLEEIHIHWIENHEQTNLMPNWRKLGICKGKNEDKSKKGHCSMNRVNQKPSGITSELVIMLAVDMFNMNGVTTEFLEAEYNSKKTEYDAQVQIIKAQNLPKSNSKDCHLMDTSTILQTRKPDNPKTKASQKDEANSAGQVIINSIKQPVKLQEYTIEEQSPSPNSSPSPPAYAISSTSNTILFTPTVANCKTPLKAFCTTPEVPMEICTGNRNSLADTPPSTHYHHNSNRVESNTYIKVEEGTTKTPLETLAVEALEEMASQSPETKRGHVLIDSNQLVVEQYPSPNSSPSPPAYAIPTGNRNSLTHIPLSTHYHHNYNQVESNTYIEVKEETAKTPLETLAVEALEEMALQSPEANMGHVLMDSNQLVVVEQYPSPNSSPSPPAYAIPSGSNTINSKSATANCKTPMKALYSTPEVPIMIWTGNGNYHHHSNPVESHTNMEVEEKTAQILLEMASQHEIRREVEVKPKVSQNVGSYSNTTKFKFKMKFPSIKALANMKKIVKQALTPFTIFPDVQTLMDVRTVMNLSTDDEINSLPEEEFISFVAKVRQVKIQWSCNSCNSWELPDVSSGFINCRDCQRLYHVSCSYQVGQYSDYTARQYDEYFSNDVFGKKYYSNFTCGCQRDEPKVKQHEEALEEGNRIIASFESPPTVNQEP